MINQRIDRIEGIKEGDFHIHTNYTDGKDSVIEYCKKAEDNNLKIVSFTEHVRKDLTYDYDDFLSEISRARSIYNGLRVLSGCEAKVTNIKGEIDVPKEILDKCDVVMGVFHSFKYSDKKNYFKAVKGMLENPVVDVWGHPTLFAKKREIMLEDDELDEIVDLCIDNNILLEKNLKYNVPDNDLLISALKKGAKVVMGSDAHSTDELPTSNRLKEEWNRLNIMF